MPAPENTFRKLQTNKHMGIGDWGLAAGPRQPGSLQDVRTCTGAGTSGRAPHSRGRQLATLQGPRARGGPYETTALCHEPPVPGLIGETSALH